MLLIVNREALPTYLPAASDLRKGNEEVDPIQLVRCIAINAS